MRRRTLSLIMALMILAGIAGTPAPSGLVCRVTGQAMAPALNADGTPLPCCKTHVSLSADGAAQDALAKSSCCDLRVGREKADAPAVFAGTVVAPAVLPTRIILPPLILSETPRPTPLLVVGAPRGPPPGGCGPRAPPVFS